MDPIRFPCLTNHIEKRVRLRLGCALLPTSADLGNLHLWESEQSSFVPVSLALHYTIKKLFGQPVVQASLNGQLHIKTVGKVYVLTSRALLISTMGVRLVRLLTRLMMPLMHPKLTDRESAGDGNFSNRLHGNKVWQSPTPRAFMKEKK